LGATQRVVDESGRVKLLWFKETSVGSGLYLATDKSFLEAKGLVVPLSGGLVFDQRLNAWRRAPGPQGTPPAPLVYPGDEALIADIVREREVGDAHTQGDGPSPSKPEAEKGNATFDRTDAT